MPSLINNYSNKDRLIVNFLEGRKEGKGDDGRWIGLIFVVNNDRNGDDGRVNHLFGKKLPITLWKRLSVCSLVRV